jgi:hypothetical protein
MTTLTDFSAMPFEKKCDIIAFGSNYLEHRVTGETKVFLYQAEQFFIEVYFSSKQAKVLMINAFADINSLDAYLDNISLADLDLN